MLMKTKKAVLKAYAFLALAAGLGLAICRTVLLKNYYDPYKFTFEQGSGGTFRIFEYIVIFLSLLALTSIFFSKNMQFQIFSARSSATSVAICTVCALLFLTIAIVLMLFYDVLLVFDAPNLALALLRLVAFFLMLSVAGYFLSCSADNASMKLSGKSRSKSALSLSLPLFAIFYLTYLYFDTTLMYHNTNKIMGQVAFISVLAFFLAEANIATGHKAYRWYFAASLVCIICVSAYILPILFLVAFWEMQITEAFLTDFALIGVLLYAIFSAFCAARTMEMEEYDF